jgi:hypothetical protein
VGDLGGVNRILRLFGQRHLNVDVTYKLFICKAIPAFLRELARAPPGQDAGDFSAKEE